ncbi:MULTISPECIES: helix-turn-helix domain-containing protein [unclassified Duganella]|uniref:helix-turn-helix domain-containing protein n=1 Tax=unclassified Duganella TaxID=2636909 RepID=UPI000E341758|nr:MULTISPECIES: helix-turn-helix transcriptional regulator [unclassified Duganella]RFP11414.1 XRE family transcriptional regulator [Duganella sp. BJB475]RFP29734.1 XRE family transcriptional regulator [Duganella sp. BJB476]
MPNLSPQRHAPALIALGGAIRRLRQERKMSQEQLALAATADRSHLGRIERGENEIAVLLLVRLAKALGVSVADVMAEAGL